MTTEQFVDWWVLTGRHLIYTDTQGYEAWLAYISEHFPRAVIEDIPPERRGEFVAVHTMLFGQ